jgi:hypothetical protein
MAGKTRSKIAKVKKFRDRFYTLGVKFVDGLCPPQYLEDWRDHKDDPLGQAWYDAAIAAVEAKRALEHLIGLLEAKAAKLGPPEEMPDFAATAQAVNVEAS